MQITDLYQTKITCSTYNANIDSTNTVITVKLIDFNGNAVTNKSVTLTCDKGYFNKKNSTSISGTTTKSITLTTNSSGEITGTWTASEWGLCTFSTNTSHTQVIVKGYKTIYNQNGIQLRAYQDKCTAIFDTGSQSFTTSETTWISGFVPTGYRPANPIITHTTANLNGIIFIENTGNLKRKSLTGSFSASVWCEMSWNY